MKLHLDDEDRDEIREEMQGITDFVPTDQEIDDAFAIDPTLPGEALSWGWGDTEVRSDLAKALEAAHNLSTGAAAGDSPRGGTE